MIREDGDHFNNTSSKGHPPPLGWPFIRHYADSPEFVRLVLRPTEPFAGHVNVLHFCKPCLYSRYKNGTFLIFKKYLELFRQVRSIASKLRNK